MHLLLHLYLVFRYGLFDTWCWFNCRRYTWLNVRFMAWIYFLTKTLQLINLILKEDDTRKWRGGIRKFCALCSQSICLLMMSNCSPGSVEKPELKCMKKRCRQAQQKRSTISNMELQENLVYCKKHQFTFKWKLSMWSTDLWRWISDSPHPHYVDVGDLFMKDWERKLD